jgi:integrase
MPALEFAITRRSSMEVLRFFLFSLVAILTFIVLVFVSSRVATDSVFRGIECSRAPVLSGYMQLGLGQSFAGGPRIVRSGLLVLGTQDFDTVHGRIGSVVQGHQGRLEELQVVSASHGSGRTLIATAPVPAEEFDSTLAQLKALGYAEEEPQTSSESSSAESDRLGAKLASAQITEDRLNRLSREHEGKLGEYLEVKQEIAKVRGEFEDLHAQQRMGTIRRLLKRAKRWHGVADDIRPLRERREVGRALAPDQKLKLLRTARSRPELQVAYRAAVLALHTTMRGCELKTLRWRDIDLLDRTVTIVRSKTEAGERIKPLNSDATDAVPELYKRAQALNTTELDHLVFPACENGKIDANRPPESWRTAWRHLTQAIECPQCSLSQKPREFCRDEECKADMRKVRSPFVGLRFHDLRHHAITELAESQASEQTIMALRDTSQTRCLPATLMSELQPKVPP